MIDNILRLVSRDTKAVGVPNDTKFRLSGIFIAAMSTDFIEHPPTRLSPVSRRRVVAHPLLRAVEREPDSVHALLEILEVGLYLDAFSDEAQIGDVVEALKSHYRSTFFQLAVAYRLRRAGCTVRIVPPSHDTQPRIRFEYGDGQHVGECHRIGRTLTEHFSEFERDLVGELMAGVPPEGRYSFTIHFNAVPSFDGMRRVRALGSQMLEEFNQRPEVSALAVRNELADLGVENLGRYEEDPDFKLDENSTMVRRRYRDADVLFLQPGAEAGHLIEVPPQHDVDSPPGSRAFVWKNLARVSPRTPLQILGSKLVSFLDTPPAGDPGRSRLLMVNFPFGLFHGLTLADRQQIEETIRGYQGVVGVALLERAFTRKNRFSFHGSFLRGSQAGELPDDLAERLIDVNSSDLFAAAP
jgi:hypothetical protein